MSTSHPCEDNKAESPPAIRQPALGLRSPLVERLTSFALANGKTKMNEMTLNETAGLRLSVAANVQARRGSTKKRDESTIEVAEVIRAKRQGVKTA